MSTRNSSTSIEHWPPLGARDSPLAEGVHWAPGRRLATLAVRGFTTPENTSANPVPGLVTNGIPSRSQQLCVDFSRGEGDVFQARVSLDEPLRGATGVAARIKIAGWADIRYVALGHYSPEGFKHIKIRHVRDDEWMTLGFDYRDLAYLVQNAHMSTGPFDASNVMLYIKGDPSSEGARLEIEWISAFRAHEIVHSAAPGDETNQAAVALKEYAARVNPFWRQEAESFLAGGPLHILPQVTREWTLDGPPPVSIEDNPTVRYAWHALAPVRSLLLLAAEGRTDASEAAHRLIHSWKRDSYDQVDPDQRYVWYDHGVAERTLVLALAHQDSLAPWAKTTHDEDIEELVTSHAQLLSSESFYAANQNSRHHNHAMFQDLVLLGLSLVSRSTAATTWRQVALYRLKDQLAALVHVESGLAVLVENSTGYHQGATSLVQLAAALQAASSPVMESGFAELHRGMQAFSSLWTYHNGRGPTQGDTFRLPADTGPSARRPRIRRGITLLPRAGYAAVHATHYSLFFFATGLSATHKHCDNLSFTLFAHGVEWLIDPSFYSHEYEAPIPAYLRGPWAHNALVVAQSDYRIDPGLVEMRSTADRSAYLLEGSHLGFDGYKVDRSVRGTTRSREIHFDDSFAALGAAHLSTDAFVVLHLGEDVKVEAGDAPGTHILSHPDSTATIEINYPGASGEVVHGWNETPWASSITGTTFQTYVDTTSLLLPVKANSGTSWIITVQGGTSARGAARSLARRFTR